MSELRTDFKDEILQEGEQHRIYNIKRKGTDEVVESDIYLEKAYEPQQEGSKFGASDINAITKAVNGIVDLIYPVGTVYETMDKNFDPNTTWGGTWVKTGKGKFPVGYDPDDEDFNTIGKTGGEKEHTLTSKEMPSHTHTYYSPITQQVQAISSGTTYGNYQKQYKIDTSSSGGNQPHNNLPPYEVRIYWKRTA